MTTQQSKIVNQKSKILTAVGLGPGDPDLITMKGLKAIQSAQIIFVPRSIKGDQSLALRIAEPWLNHDRQQVVDLLLPMTRDSDQLVPAWQAAANQIATEMETSGATSAVYLLLGDPLLYGTFTYIWQQMADLHPNIGIKIIPGITSFAAAAAHGQIPLSTTDDRVVVLPASYETDANQLRNLLTDFDTVILMKVGTVLPQILAALDELDLLDSALYAERIGMPEEFVATGPELRALKNQRRPYLSLLIVRKQ
jgi:precorrin-2/cobalt-factor-2 C20-methyltransferase